LVLGHRRLSILDLSPAGHQPMLSACGRYVIAFNGEIYNHLALREKLTQKGQAPNWRGHSDTETLLVSIRKRKRLNFLLNYNKRGEASTCFCYHEQSNH
jgi:asparagine synthase (glutamine-hydrolysing)